MCGLTGFDLRRCNISFERKLVLTSILANRCDSRGGQSGGFYAPKQGVRKTMGDVAQLSIEMARQNIVMAHSRFSTHGANNKQNAHPFEIGNVIGAHNGVLGNHEELNKKYERKFEVDSMHLFAHIDEGRSFEDINGYGAITFIRKDKGMSKLHLLKMSGGDLSIWGVGSDPKNCKGVIWGSVDDFVKDAAAAAGIKIFEFQVDVGKVYVVENGVLLKTNEELNITRSYSAYNNYSRYTSGGANNDAASHYSWYDDNWSGNSGEKSNVLALTKTSADYHTGTQSGSEVRRMWDLGKNDDEKDLHDWMENKDAETVLEQVKEAAKKIGSNSIFVENKNFVDIDSLTKEDCIKILESVELSQVTIEDLLMPVDSPNPIVKVN